MRKILPGLLLAVSGSTTQAQAVFSRYNYYMTDSGSVVCVLPDSVPQSEVHLDLGVGGTTSACDHRIVAEVPLSLGTTRLHYRLTWGGDTLATGDVELTRLAPKANAVQIDRLTGGLIADGLPFFPFGFYCGPVGDLPELEVVHGFNMIGPYQDNLPAGLPARKAYMDRCAELGMKVQYGVNSLVGSGHNGDRGLEMTEDQKLDLLKSEVLAFRDHPALLSWYMNDEPDGQGRPPAVLERAYKLIHELDPYHPVSIVLMLPTKAAEFAGTTDIAMTDPYPIPGPADQVLNYLDKYNAAYRYAKSVWLVPQAFGGQEMWPREPSAKEIRLMTYMGLVDGAKGIQYFIHARGDLNPQSVSAWSACSDMAVETAQMASFLLSGEPAPEVHSEDPKLLTRAFRYQGNLLIIVVNDENTPKAFSITVDGKAPGDTAELWFENRRVPFAAGRLNDMIDAYGTRVYLIRAHGQPPAIPGNLTLNPGFEQVISPGLAMGSNVTHTSAARADPGATFFVDPREHVEGLFSLRLVTPVDSGGDRIRLVPMVLQKGNSYTVSVWAKGMQQDQMPSFRLAFDDVRESHTYELSDNWRPYWFTFRAPESTTNAILALDLVQKGTAWFDLLEVAPDPIIRYFMQPDHSALVTVSSNNSEARLHYAENKEPDAGSPVYGAPFPVTKATTVYAALFAGDRRVAGASLFIPVNKALGKPVTLAHPYNPHYAANGDSTLTDGQMGTTYFKDGRWLGFSGNDMDAKVDLETATEVRQVTASFLCDPNSGIFLPSQVDVFTSRDGKNFKVAGSVRNTVGSVRGEPYLEKFRLRLNGAQVRFIRVVAKTIGPIPEGYLFKGTTSWLFADEILVE